MAPVGQNTTEGKPESLPTWPGFTLKELQDFAMTYCRSRARVVHFGGSQPTSIWNTSVRRVGQLVRKTLEDHKSNMESRGQVAAKPIYLSRYLQKIKSERVFASKDAIYALVGTQDSSSPSHIPNEGEIRRWFKTAEHCLRFLLMGTEEASRDETKADYYAERDRLFKKIRDYFFEPMESDGSGYFLPIRRYSQGPFTSDEALKGVGWLYERLTWIRQTIAPDDFRGRMVVVSGEAETIFRDESGRLNPEGETAIHWAGVGFDTVFVYPKETQDRSGAARNIKAFLERIKRDYKDLKYRFFEYRLDPAEKNPLSSAAEFLHRTGQYYYFEYPGKPEEHGKPSGSAKMTSELYVRLTNVLQEKDEDLHKKDVNFFPFLYLANEDLKDQFLKWLGAIVPDRQELEAHQDWREKIVDVVPTQGVQAPGVVKTSEPPDRKRKADTKKQRKPKER